MEQKQRENEEYIARKNSEIAELEKEHEELKRRNLFDIDLEKKVQDQKSDVDIEKSLDSIRTDMEQTVKVSSNAADQNGTSSGSPSTRDLKHQTGSSENTSEGTIVMTVGKISTLSDKIFSAPKRVQGVSWRIVVMPIQRVVEREKKQQKYLGVFLQCCPDKHSDAWSCKADAEMRLMPKKAGAKNFVRETNHVYTSKEDDWGYSCFMPMADVLDENNGYIKYDMITLKITVKAEGLKNLI